MYVRAHEKRAAQRRASVYLANFFFSLHYAAVLYINSSFLANFFSARSISILFVAGAALNVLLYLLSPHLLRRLGNRVLFVSLILLEAFATLGLASASSPLSAGLFFVLYAALPLMVFYSIDIFIETASTDNETGSIRGMLLTLGNLAIALAPLLVSWIAPDGNFSRLYAVAAGILALPLLVWLARLKHFPDDGTAPLSLPFRAWAHNDNIRRVSIARFMLEFFYSLMVIYMPLYLHTVIGFDWETIGVIFFFMLLPFVFFELPVGKLADHWCGEVEIQTIGFFITGLALLVMPFLGSDPIIWAATLFMSRVGAAFIEVTTDSYFFKKVSAKDTGLIAIFRLVRPVSIAAGAAVGGFLYAYSATMWLFFLAGALLIGMNEGARLVDTK